MQTVLITGATEGIGREFAKIFAEKKFNLILVARNEEKLRKIADEMNKKGISAVYYAKDLSKVENAASICDDLQKQNVKVDFLINNAGFGINETFTDIPWENESAMYNLNMISLAYLTKFFAADMKTRHFGRILNVGSTGSFQPGPFMAGYCATKAFVLSLSEAVNYELKGTGVTVSVLCPGVTDSKFHDVADTNTTGMSKFLTHASSEEVARYGYKILMKQKSVAIQGFMNKIMIFSNRITCRKIIVSVAGKLLKKNK